MVTNFADLEIGAYDETEMEVFSIVTEQIKDYDASSENSVVQRLADAVVAFCTDKCSEDGFDIKGVLDLVFGVIVEIASFVPHNDTAHDGLVRCLLHIRKHDDLRTAIKEVRCDFPRRPSPSWMLISACRLLHGTMCFLLWPWS